MAENVGIYTDDSSLTLKINQYNGYQDLTCAQILEAIKNTDSYNENAIGFVAVPTSQEGYEIQAFNYAAGDLLSIWNCFPDWTLEGGDTNYIYWNVSNPTTVNVRSRQYYGAVFSSNKWSFSGYRDAYFGNHTYDGITYYGKGNNSTSLSYSHAVLYISNLSAFTEIYFNGNPLVTYTWQSVPSISGKNGILSLSTINASAINNGNPVTGATSDTFHSTEDSKIEELVTYATPIDSSKLESFTCVYQATPPFATLKLLVKKNSAPQDEEDADLVVNLPNPVLSTGIDEYTATNLDPLTDYFCVVQVSDNGGHYKYSDPAEVRTGFMDRNFDYTGSIQTFVAPKTGIYQLETWGAQGGNATDGTLVARGGYGAYAYGEVLLQQGDTIYINVGGQNGYGGGGAEWITGEYNYSDVALSQNCSNYINSGADSGGQVVEDNEVYFRPYFYTDKMFEMGTEYRRACINNTEDNCYEVPMPPSSLGDNNPYTVWQLPIKNMRNITKIDIEVKMTKATYTNEEHWIGFQFIKFTSASERAEVGGNQITIGRYNPNGNYSYYDYYYLDDNWHTLSLSFSNVDYADYISIASVRGQYDFRIKKIYGDLQYP